MHISATNRGSERVEADFYATPIPVVKNFLHNHKLQRGYILEPSAGNGNIIMALREEGYNNYNPITALELREEERNNLYNSGIDKVIITDFLNWQPDREYTTIIGNPPYTYALEFINKCFEIATDKTEIIILLRTAFLESKKRFSFWQKHPVNGLYVLSQRPSFTGKGTDATSYAFFVWDGSDKQVIKVI